ncbi:MAG: alpha/beta hydrolase [Rhodospirillales bacterium]|nr:alpha/beta hydrolase [Rhodospirillales bacterium]MBO6787427.1 alpha/beta hydrolase [Rhodospirillales bacterium]
MFEGFEQSRISVDGVGLNVRYAGEGPGVVLLHGYPQTHIIWRHIAPSLAATHTVVVPDTRGYGDSDCPPSDPGHLNYSKRTMANDVVAVMHALGHDTFSVISHDRGARVGYRLALDHPDRVMHYMSLDVVPTHEMWVATDKNAAMGSFHWMFLAQAAPQPETMIGHDPDGWVEWLHRSWAAPDFEFEEHAMAAYKRAFRNPDVIRGTCEDYRAGATCDDEDDATDFNAGRKIQCPITCLWGAARAKGGPKEKSPLDIWRNWGAAGVDGEAIARSGHFIPEEAPDDVIRWAKTFLDGNA